jgi:polysaccharide deacetylase 2 family uncharacterized protein YibQ
MRVPGWRALGLFWAVVLGTGLGGGLWLQRLGPPAAMVAAPAAGNGPPAATAPATADVPVPAHAPAPSAEPASAAPPPTAQQDAPPVAQASADPAPAAVVATAPPAAPPSAPEPPPLAAAAAPRATARPIAAPDPALLEAGRHGMLPRAGTDGRTSIRAYGRDFDRRDTRPRIGIVVADIGLNATHTEEAIRRLPPAVALALSPYAARPGQAADRARERGMETLISIPMEPAGYPQNNPGDQALLTGRSMTENMDRLDWVLSRAQGYVGGVGAIGGMRGERFAAMPEAMATVQDALRLRGLLYLDPRPGAPPPSHAWGRSVDILLDEPAGTRGEIDRRLAELEAVARNRGAALGLAGAATPVLVERIAAWAVGLEARGLVLAPVTAMIRRPEGITPEAGSNPVRPASAP